MIKNQETLDGRYNRLNNMHYSERLKQEAAILEARLANAEKTIQEFRKHLESTSFHNDPTIQVRDVNNYLLDILDDIRGIA